jgi:UDP-sugar transporter A1/2/3
MRIVTQPPVFVLASISLTFGLLGINQGEFVAAFSNHPRIGSLRKHASSQPRLNNNKIYPTTTRYRRIKETDLRSTPLVIPKSAYFLSLLALQFGLQPILTKKFTPNNIIRSTVVLAQDTSRFLICLLMIFLTGNFNISVQKWTLQQALLGAGIPSALYLVQNYCSLMAYQNLPPITYNILNQTKTLSAALCCYLVMGKRQSPLQVVSLLVLLMSALVLEKIVPVGNWKTKSSKKGVIEEHKEEEFTTLKRPDLPAGVIPILVASFISGLGK